MSGKYKTNTGNLYYLTITVEGRIDLFTRKEYAEFIEANINYCIENKGLEIFSYCMMPSHIHLIARTFDYNISKWLRDYEGFTSRKLYEIIQNHTVESRKEWLQYLFKYFTKPLNSNKKFKLWHKGNHLEEIYSQQFHKQKETYTHKIR